LTVRNPEPVVPDFIVTKNKTNVNADLRGVDIKQVRILLIKFKKAEKSA